MEVALLLADPVGSPPKPRAVAVAFLAVIRHLSASGPVVLAVDDLQWLDDPSARVLDFALRRLSGEPAGLLASARDPGHGRPMPAAGLGLPAERLTRLRVGPLAFSAFQSAVRATAGSGLSLLTIRRVFDASGGNPFYGLELAAEYANWPHPRLPIHRIRGCITPARWLCALCAPAMHLRQFSGNLGTICVR